MTIDPRASRLTTARMLHKAQAAHLGCCFSAVEILAAIYGSVDIDAIRRKDRDRDRVYISKGHCAAAVYATMHHAGLIPAEALETYCKAGSRLIGLVGHGVPGVEHSTGSLGHGLGVAVGTAIALARRGSKARVFCMLGDGELQEGSNYEAMMLAGQENLSNVTAIIDNNGLGMIGRTREVLDTDPRRFGAFGWRVLRCFGHSVEGIQDLLRKPANGQPTVIDCATVKGRGYKPAENKVKWHYRPPADMDLAAMEAAFA